MFLHEAEGFILTKRTSNVKDEAAEGGKNTLKAQFSESNLK